jgi:hypothetical protein
VIATIAEQRKRNCGTTVSLHSSGRHFLCPKQTFLYLFAASHSRAGREAFGRFRVGRRGVRPRRFESDPAAALQILLIDLKRVFQRYRRKADVQPQYRRRVRVIRVALTVY